MFKYEDIVEDFESTLSDILSFLGEKYESKIEKYHEKQIMYYSKIIKKPSSAIQKYHKPYRNWQINQPLFDGRGKWKRLSEEELSLINTNAGEMLVEFGYLDEPKR